MLYFHSVRKEYPYEEIFLIRAVFALMTASAITLSFAACGASSGGSAAQTNSSAAYDAAYEEENRRGSTI